LFLNPTPGALALEITARLAKNNETLDALLTEIEAVSDDEARIGDGDAGRVESNA